MTTTAKNSSLRLLTAADLALLREQSTVIEFAHNDVILVEGTLHRRLFMIESGHVCIAKQQGERRILLAHLGEGQVFGEMAFLEAAPTSASVIADGDVRVHQLDEMALNSILGSDPGFSARFYHSLAITLSARLRDSSQKQSKLNVNEVAQVTLFHRTRLGLISQRQVPEQLRGDLSEITQQFRELERKGDVQLAAETCERVLRLLDSFTDSNSLIEIGFDDLMSFHLPDELDEGIGAFVFREMFPFFMQSTAMAHCYMKPRGFSDDYMTGEIVFANAPSGDGVLGPLIDRWFLSRPYCTSRREARILLFDRLVSIGKGTPGVCHVTKLACAAGRELIEAAAAVGTTFHGIGVDIDSEALAFANGLAGEAGVTEVAFANANVMDLVNKRGHLDFPPQAAVYSVGLIDYLRDDDATRLIRWIHTILAPGGTAMFTITRKGHVDERLLTDILEWTLLPRSEEEISSLFEAAGSVFDNLSFEKTPSGSLFLVSARRG